MSKAARIVFFGTPNWASDSLHALFDSRHEVVGVVTSPDAARKRSKRKLPSSVKSTALALGIEPILQPRSLRPRAVRESILSLDPDLLVVVAYGKIVPGRLLDAPRFGAINLHFSLLPKHRGASPVQHTILHGDEMAGITVMQMDRGLDTGPIIQQEQTPVVSGETAPELGERLAGIGARALVESIDDLCSGRADPRAQDDSRATLAPILSKDDGIVDWSERHDAIDRKVRAFASWPPVVTTGPRGTLKLIQVSPTDERHSEPVGTVLRKQDQGVIVTCGEGTTLHLLRVQPSGSREMDAAAALNGGHLVVGERLGPSDAR